VEKLPKIEEKDIINGYEQALKSPRRRHPKILHKTGDYNNKVLNFLLQGTYMQPHKHVGREKIEKMTLLEGSFELIYFDDLGEIINREFLSVGNLEYIEVPSNTWHTYVMKEAKVLVYETMEGVYNPKTWKNMAEWAPTEGSPKAKLYLEKLTNLECGQ